MLFNKIEFAFFSPLVFLIYWLVFGKNLKWQNLFLLATSFFFFACFDWRFLFLLIFSILLDFSIAKKIYKSTHNKKTWLWISIVVNLCFLGFFKYFNFFVDSFSELISFFGFKPNFWSLKIILPIGISFYIFHGLSYVIDVYNQKIRPVNSIVDYSLFVSFFPLLVAGPIERATHLLPQIKVKREFSYEKAVNGLRQILWGLFKKMVIADNCAVFANQIFANSSTASGSELLLGAIFFTFQIYGDFSGYSDIALGTARLFGMDLLRNFAFPYFSRDMAEFWRRWHISLSSWFKDYLYIPLGGSKGGNWMRIRNTFIIFLVSGFWHGANWTFIIWGFLNALFIMPSIILKTNRNNLEIVAMNGLIPSIKDIFNILFTFSLTVFAWVFFRAEDVHHAISYILGIFKPSLFSFPELKKAALATLILIIFFVAIEWIGRENQYAIEKTLVKKPRALRWAFYGFIIILIGLFLQTHETPFIYFQF